jgi:hypothetical protein
VTSDVQDLRAGNAYVYAVTSTQANEDVERARHGNCQPIANTPITKRSEKSGQTRSGQEAGTMDDVDKQE